MIPLTIRSLLLGAWVIGALEPGLTSLQAVPFNWTVLDAETDQAVPCRIHLKDAAGKTVRAGGLPFWNDHFVAPGRVMLELAPGVYSFEVDRGPEYHLSTGQLVVTGTSGQTMTNRLTRLSTLTREGWWSGETHVHRALPEVELLMKSEDLHVAPIITWWNDQNPWHNQPLPAHPLVQFDSDRFYQMMGGEDERAGGALLFFNIDQPLAISGAGREYPSPMQFVREARQRGAWIEIEKPFWYDVPVWLASGQVDAIGIAHDHMQRGGVLANEAWGRPRDLQRFSGVKGNGLWTQEIYYHALNAGLRLPPTAGSASGVLANPVGYNRVYVHTDGDLTYEKWWAGLKAGRVFVSNGPLLRCRADGELPGHVFTMRPGEAISLKLEAKLDSRDPVSVVEIIHNGRVVRSVPSAEWRKDSTLAPISFKENGWFLVRAIADVSHTFRFASTGPFYVDVQSSPRRVSRASAQFFLDWVRERMGQIQVDNAVEREDVLRYQREAEQFWKQKVAEATVE